MATKKRKKSRKKTKKGNVGKADEARREEDNSERNR
jgi:hypothetical protein